MQSYMPFFEALNIDKSYNGCKALDNVTISIPQGSIYGLLGPNGAGKTTLIRIINKITAPDRGKILFKGKTFRNEDLSLLGYLPEERGLYKKMKVGEQALYLAQLKGMKKQDALKKLHYWFEKFEMSGWWNKRVEELSKGMAQKVQFIITILHDPELLIFDEPFSGFDPINASLLKNEVQELKKKGVTIIFSTHDMASVEELCDHITLINKSKTILEGSVQDIKEKYKSNVYRIHCKGNLEKFIKSTGEKFQLQQSVQISDNHFSVLISTGKNKSGNEILQSIIRSAEVISFQEVLPSMNEVFIKAVNES